MFFGLKTSNPGLTLGLQGSSQANIAKETLGGLLFAFLVVFFLRRLASDEVDANVTYISETCALPA